MCWFIRTTKHTECIFQSDMNSEDLTKKIEDLLRDRSLEEYLRENMITQEQRDYIDKLWTKPIYEKFDENRTQNT